MISWVGTFETPFGVAGAAGSFDIVNRIVLPGQDRADTMAQLVWEFPDATEVEPSVCRTLACLEKWARENGGAPRFSFERMTGFTRSVLSVIASIPRGNVASYKWIATKVGKPGAARAVGAGAGRNPVPMLVPCHRVVGHGGELTGFSASGGLDLKKRMLLAEGIKFLPGSPVRVDKGHFLA